MAHLKDIKKPKTGDTPGVNVDEIMEGFSEGFPLGGSELEETVRAFDRADPAACADIDKRVHLALTSNIQFEGGADKWQDYITYLFRHIPLIELIGYAMRRKLKGGHTLWQLVWKTEKEESYNFGLEKVKILPWSLYEIDAETGKIIITPTEGSDFEAKPELFRLMSGGDIGMYGYSLYNRLSYVIRTKQYLIKDILPGYITRYTSPMPTVYANEGDDTPVGQMISDFVKDPKIFAGMKMPFDSKIDWKEFSLSGGQLIIDIFRYFNRISQMMILGGNLTSEVTSGSLAAANVHEKLLNYIVESDIRQLEWFINHDIIELAIKIESGGTAKQEEIPKFKMNFNAQYDPKSLLDAVRLMLEGKDTRIPIDFLHQIFNIPLAGDGEETLEPENTTLGFSDIDESKIKTMVDAIEEKHFEGGGIPEPTDDADVKS